MKFGTVRVMGRWASIAILAILAGSCGGGGGSGSTAAAAAGAAPGADQAVVPAISKQPLSQSVPVGFPAVFSVAASGTPAPSIQWQKNGADIAGATGAMYMTPPVAVSDTGAQFAAIATNSAGHATSSAARLTVSGPDVVTFHNDAMRSGVNPYETTLTTTSVTGQKFGLLRLLATDGLVDAQPLYLARLAIAGASHNVVYAVTENDSIYAYDTDSGTLLWNKSALLAGETASDSRGCGQVVPIIGITATPVIDRGAGPHGAIYFIAMSKDGGGSYHQRLHALDLTTGAELFGGPTTIAASYPSSNGTVTFDAKQYKERAALLLLNGTIYMGFSSHCDAGPYTGWLMGYSESTLKQTTVLNLTPNGSEGSIWQSGGGPAADSNGNIYFLDANGTFDTTLNAEGFPNKGDFGNAFLKVSTTGGLKVADYFSTYNTVQESDADQDLGSGGAILLPDLVDASGKTRQLAVGAGKDGHIFVVDRTAMGKFNTAQNASSNPNVYQDVAGALNGKAVFAVPAYFNGVLYYGAINEPLEALPVTAARVGSGALTHSPGSFGYPGTTPSVSANGTTGAVVWAVENSTPATLHAYDAADLTHELYNSSQQGARDQFGAGNKYIVPSVVDGKVLIGTPNAVAVFGILP